MTAVVEQLRQAVRRCSGVNALTGPLIVQQLDLVAQLEGNWWRRWRLERRAGIRVDAAAVVRSIEGRHQALGVHMGSP